MQSIRTKQKRSADEMLKKLCSMKRWDKYKPILLRIKVLYDAYSEYSKECRNNLILGYDQTRTHNI